MKRKTTFSNSHSKESYKRTSFNTIPDVRTYEKYLERKSDSEKTTINLMQLNNTIAAYKEGILDPSKAERLGKKFDVVKAKDMDSKLWVQKMLTDKDAPKGTFKFPDL